MGLVKDLRNLTQFDLAMSNSAGKIVVVMYHNARQSSEEQNLEEMQKEFKNLTFLKVNTLQALDITREHADGGPKPYYKFYAYGAMIDEVKYTNEKEEMMKKLKEQASFYDKQMQGQ